MFCVWIYTVYSAFKCVLIMKIWLVNPLASRANCRAHLIFFSDNSLYFPTQNCFQSHIRFQDSSQLIIFCKKNLHPSKKKITPPPKIGIFKQIWNGNPYIFNLSELAFYISLRRPIIDLPRKVSFKNMLLPTPDF